MKRILHNKPCLGDEEMFAVNETLRSDWLIAGKKVQQFEDNFKKYIGKKYAIAVNSGTSALHLSLLSLNVGKNDEVIIPTYTASDILNAIYYTRATPVLVDTAINSPNIDTTKIEKKITKKTKAMIIPHTFGIPVDIPSLMRYKIPVIEDCAQAVGSVFQNKRVGSFGTISIFSFFATKLLTTGQGGIILTDDRDKYEYIKDLINYNGRDNYKIRYNYPLTDIAASIGNEQLKKYIDFSKKRIQIANRYQAILENKKIVHLPKKKDTNVVPFRFLFFCSSGRELKRIVNDFSRNGIELRQPFMPHELLHKLLNKEKREFINSENFVKTALSLPIYPCLSGAELDYITHIMFELL